MKESQTEVTRMMSLKERARYLAETAVGLVTAPFFLATTLDFPFGVSLADFNPNANNSRGRTARLFENQGKIKIPDGITATVKADGCLWTMRDQKDDQMSRVMVTIGGHMQPNRIPEDPKVTVIGGRTISLS